MKKELFSIVGIKERKDGSADLTLDYSLEFADVIKAHYGKKKLTKKMISDFVIGAIKGELEEYEGNKN